MDEQTHGPDERALEAFGKIQAILEALPDAERQMVVGAVQFAYGSRRGLGGLVLRGKMDVV